MIPRVQELHCIMPIGNIPSVIQYGILSNKEASKLPHESVALEVIQNRRDAKKIPGGLKLHQYANLYFCARNPMLCKRQNERDSICVLQVNRRILLKKGTVLTDQNAASGYARFFPSPSGLHDLDFDLIYAEDWRHSENRIQYWRHKSVKCAEVLVPNQVPFEYIEGAYVANETAQAALLDTGFELSIELNPKMFFLGT